MKLNLKQGEYLGENLQVFETVYLKLSLTAYAPDSFLKTHYHDNNYLSILMNGRYQEKGSGNTELVSCGDILFRPDAYDHENRFGSGGGVCFNIEFKKGWERHFDLAFSLPVKYGHFRPGTFPSLYRLMINFKNGFNEDLGFESITEWLVAVNGTRPGKKMLPCIETATRILEEETGCFHSLESLSRRVFVHPVYLSRAFREKKGVTISEYQLRMKLAYAMSLLLNTEMSISDISFRNGFYDDAHFIRSFKAVYRESPARFRRLTKS